MTLRDLVGAGFSYRFCLLRSDFGQTAERILRGSRRGARGERGGSHARAAASALALGITLLTFGLVGCGIGEQVASVVAPEADTIPARAVNGNVHGGVYPIVGATISLMQTVTNATSTYRSAAKLLLTATSDVNGNFNFADGWPCATNEFAYLVVTGGHTSNLPNGSVNNSVIQVGVVGPCSSLVGATAQATAALQHPINVFLSEVSTVASAAALGNFVSISPNDGSGTQIVNISAPLKNSTALNCPNGNTCASGLEHGFTNAATLVNSVSLTGANLTGEGNITNPRSYTASGLPGSAIPGALLNTIGNIMQACVDSAGGSTNCSKLFSAATGVAAGTVPQNTLQAALNIVQNPGYNITNLYALQAPNAPFSPNLNAAPTSFAVSIFYGVTYNGSTGGSLNQYPVDVALDASDSAWVLYENQAPGGTTAPAFSAIDQWLADGTHKATGSQAANAYLYPSQIAIAPSGNIYATNNDPNTTTNDFVLQWNGGVLRQLAALSGASGIAVNSFGNVFASSTTTGTASVTEYTSGGSGSTLTLSSQSTTAASGAIYGLAIDTSQNVWGTGTNGSSVVQALVWPKTNKTPPYQSNGSLTQVFSGASAPFSVAPSAGTTMYYPMNNELMSASYISSYFTVNSAVAAVQSAGPPVVPSAAVPHRSQVDGSGRVFWTDLESTGNVNYYTSGQSPAAVSSFVPCFTVPVSSTSYACITTNNQTTSTSGYTPANLRGMAIDSAGNMWYLADAGLGAIIETLGVASPTWPLLSYGHPGCKPGTGTAACP